jgi:hypothetical protein
VTLQVEVHGRSVLDGNRKRSSKGQYKEKAAGAEEGLFGRLQGQVVKKYLEESVPVSVMQVKAIEPCVFENTS